MTSLRLDFLKNARAQGVLLCSVSQNCMLRPSDIPPDFMLLPADAALIPRPIPTGSRLFCSLEVAGWQVNRNLPATQH